MHSADTRGFLKKLRNKAALIATNGTMAIERDDHTPVSIASLYPTLVSSRRAQVARSVPDLKLLDDCIWHPASRLSSLKILVVSTPKTGNTWVKHLLARAYQLPARELPTESSEIDWDGMGDRWIAHQHYLPSPELIAEIERRKIYLVTTIRHPGDVFISLFHHAQILAQTSNLRTDIGYMRNDGDTLGPHALAFLRDGFKEHLHLSLAWMELKKSLVIRYEDLCHQPFDTLTAVTSRIIPVRSGRIKQALAESELDELRRAAPVHKEFFRKGGTGSWVEELPDTFRGVLEVCDPLPAQTALLGYSMEASHRTNSVPYTKVAYRNPFRGRHAFDNGVPVAPILREIYFELPESVSASLSPSLGIGTNTFYRWLNEWCLQRVSGTSIMITRSAKEILQRRADVNRVIPDALNRGRRAFALWFLRHGLQEHSLHDAFGLELFGRPWDERGGDALSLLGSAFENGVPFGLTVLEFYFSVPAETSGRWRNLRRTTPDTFFAWMIGPMDTVATTDETPKISRLAYFLYQLRPDVRAAFPDPLGHDRVNFADWIRERASEEFELDARLL